MSVDIPAVAGEVATVDEAVMKALPTIAMFAGFIPGASIITGFEPEIMMALKALDDAAKAVAGGNPGMAFRDVLGAITSHLTPGMPNSPILSDPPPST